MRALQAFALTIFTLSVLAGESGIPGVPHGNPLEKKFKALQGLAIDSADNFYFSDSELHQVFKLTPAGNLLIVAGTGTKGYSGDGGAATAAELGRPNDVLLDKAGNLYVSCETGYVIRKINPKGIITTFAGNGKHGEPNDGAVAGNSSIPSAGSMALDVKGNFYFTSYFGHRVYRITNGLIYLFAGNNLVVRSDAENGDGGKAVKASVGYPVGVATGANGVVYISCCADGNKKSNALIRSVDASGTIRTFAGVGKAGFAGDGGPALKAEFFNPAPLFMDKSETLYIADRFN